jgi:hypothetical protein
MAVQPACNDLHGDFCCINATRKHLDGTRQHATHNNEEHEAFLKSSCQMIGNNLREEIKWGGQ